MEQQFELPLKPEKGTGKQVPIRPLEEAERTAINYAKIAGQFYEALKQRNAAQAKETIKRVRAGTALEKRTLYLPEVALQNQLAYLLHQHRKEQAIPIEAVSKKLKEELNKKIAESGASAAEHEQQRISLHQDLEKMLRGVESVLAVVQSRQPVKEVANDYFIGTSDILDATQKIDLIEYAASDNETVIRFIQVKTGAIEPAEIATITKAHQAYLDSFIPAIADIVHKEYDEAFQSLLEKKDEPFTDEELTGLQKKWNVISLAAAETGGKLLSVQQLQQYIEQNIIGYSDPVSVDDILFFKEIVTSPVLSRDVTDLLDGDFLPKGEREEFINYMDTLEEDFTAVLERYTDKSKIDPRKAVFYSSIITLNGTQKEQRLENKIGAEKVDKI